MEGFNMRLGNFCKHHCEYLTSVPYLDLTKPIEEKAEPLLTYKGVGMLYRNNLQALQGKPKQGKSTAGIAFIIALLKGDYLGLSAKEGCTVLWLDTEQDRDTVQEKALQALQIAETDKCTARLKIVALKPYDVEERLKYTLQAIQENNPDFVFLDGIVDLVQDFNKPDECKALLDTIAKVTERNNCALLTLIHENKNDENAIGHLGSFVHKKASEVYSVKKSETCSYDEEGKRIYRANVKQVYNRYKEVEPFAFVFGTNGMPEQSPDEVQTEKSNNLSLWGEIFATLPNNGNNPEGYTYTDVSIAYAEHCGVSQNAGKKAASKAVELGSLIKEGEGRNVRYKYAFANSPFDINEDEL